MKIFPAIDIIGAKAVRLTQGDYDRVKVYDSDPVNAALEFKAQGARCLHVVDLDGAKTGTSPNYEVICRIVRETGMFVQVGGGIRDMDRISKYLGAGIGRVILGTAAVNSPDFLTAALGAYGDAIAVGVDAKNGRVAVNGWQETTAEDSFGFVKRLKTLGVSAVIYTDIHKDGAMGGTNLQAYEKLNKLGINIIASGGITFEWEIEKLKELDIYGAVVGKAIYEGRLNLKDIMGRSEEK